MPDPMDSPPTDHGADRFDYVEVDAPFGLEPAGEWWEKLLEVPCPDCRANLFVRWGFTLRHHDDPAAWHVVVAHDDGCPRLAQAERRES